MCVMVGQSAVCHVYDGVAGEVYVLCVLWRQLTVISEMWRSLLIVVLIAGAHLAAASAIQPVRTAREKKAGFGK